MLSLFISYRRGDSPDTVKLIYERLTKRLPRWEMFYDHDSIPLGDPFPARLRAKVTAATAVLVIIGPKWLEILRERKSAPIDHVREEVRLGLEAGASVVPILVSHAVMPTDADLVEFADLLPLLKRNGRPMRPDPDFDSDLEPIVAHLKSLDSAESVGTILDDKYTLTAEIGDGGMGVVYAAQQKKPVQRMVAVKLIKPGMDSRDVLARFDAERQALAVMDHPNVAKVLDAGMTPHGRPFFVMEYVKGVPITQYCDDKKLNPQERLNLFIPVCNAVQHAHQKGIIHRDLKPSNVLVEVVDGKPVPKVIDFGLAKALGQKLTDKTLHTALEMRVGTLEYSAPEQAAGRSFDVDTRSDIYSLGVLLYELLTGAPPFTHEQLLKIGEEEMRRVIREVEPTTPSKKLSISGELPAIAAKRDLEPGKLTRLVQGDLDWIVMKCLEKENARRYETANQLGQELQRFLADEPVQAGPPSAGYRMKKFLRRNKGPVSAVAIVLLALVAGIVGTSIGLVQAEWARAHEKNQRERAEKSEGKEKLATQRALNIAEANKELARVADERRYLAEKLAIQSRFDYFYFRSWEEPAVAMVGYAQLLPEALKLRDRSLADSILRQLGGWSGEMHSLRAVVSQQGLVWAVAVSPDRKTVVTGGDDRTARLWDVATGKQLGPALQHQGAVRHVAFGPDGKTIVTRSDDNTVRLWEVATGKQLGPDLKHQNRVSAVDFSPDGKTVLTGRHDYTARLWEVATGKQLGPDLQHQDGVTAVAFSPDGKTVLTGSHDRTARLWEAATGKQLGRALRHQGVVEWLAFSPDGKTVLTSSIGNRLTSSKPNSVVLWAVATGNQIGPALQHQGNVWAVAFSPDSKTMLTGSYDNTARLWEVSTGKQLGPALHHNDQVMAVAFGPDGKTVLTGSSDGTARLWEVGTGKQLGPALQHQNYVWAVAFSPDGKTVLTGSHDKTARLWEVATGKQLGPALHHQGNVGHVAFSPDGRTVLTRTDDNTVRLWGVATGKQLGSDLQHQNQISAVAFSPDGKTVLTGSFDNTARLWEVATGKQIGPALQHQGTVKAVGPSWLEGLLDRDGVNAVAFSPDGKTVLTGSWDKTARLWEVATGKQLGPNLQHQHAVSAVAFSPDGKTVLTGSYDKTARLWEAATGKQLGPALQHQVPMLAEMGVRAVAFSPDGKAVLTGSNDKTARLWEVATGTKLGPALQHQGVVTAVAFSPNGKTVLTAGAMIGRRGCGRWPPASNSAPPYSIKTLFTPVPSARTARPC